MACAALDRQRVEHPEMTRRTRAQLIAQIDPLSGWARLHDGELLPPTSLKHVMKTLPGRGGILRLRPVTDTDLTAYDLGRDSREPSLALRELLGSLDGERCRFPGCTRHKKLHAHHVVYWSADGRTDLSNLAIVRQPAASTSGRPSQSSSTAASLTMRMGSLIVRATSSVNRVLVTNHSRPAERATLRE